MVLLQNQNIQRYLETSHKWLDVCQQISTFRKEVLMTQNQINYQNMLENKRNNVATLTELNRHQVATESETNRHNVVTEGQQAQSLTELNRHNAATEKETKRSNIVSQKETRRHNKATERLTKRGQNVTKRGQNIEKKNALLKLQNDLAIAKENNASRERIAELERQIKQYTAELNAKTALATNAATNEMQRKIAQLNSDTRIFEKKMDKLIADNKNLTETQVANINSETQKAVQHAKNISAMLTSGDETDRNNAKLEIDKFKAEIDLMYKQGQLTNEAMKNFNKMISDMELAAAAGAVK